VKAEDAVLLDTSEMDIAAAVEAARRIVDDARARWLESSAPGRG
jgi:cytidylate kinase